MRDPLLHHVYQPLVDTTGLDPRPAAEHAATGFVVCAVALSAMRVAAYGPPLGLTQAMHVAGAVMLSSWMRWCARNGAAARIGAVGAMHAGFRWILVLCVVLDLVDLARVAGHVDLFPRGALLRTLVATLEDSLGASALFLSACDGPPPRRRTSPSFA